jgi:UDP-glucose 4-epimerase
VSKILVCGGAGFIGGHLTEELVKRGHDVSILDDLSIHNKKVPHWLIQQVMNCKLGLGNSVIGENGDCTNMSRVAKTMMICNPDVIFNLAVHPLPESLINPKHVFDTNVEITHNILQMMMGREEGGEKKSKLIHFSSSEVYGTCLEAPMTEHHELNPTTPYAASKAACDHLVMSYVKTFGINATIVRPFNTYGPRQNDKSYAGVIPATIKRIENGQRPLVTGNGGQTRDFTYVSDIVKGAIYAMEDGRVGEVYNLCSGKEVTIRELVSKIAILMDYTGPFDTAEDRDADVRRHIGSEYKARDELGWEPTVELEDGLEKTVEWYKQ